MAALPSIQIGPALRSLFPRAALVATLALSSDQSPDTKIAAPVRDTYAACTPDNYAGATSVSVDHTKSLLSYKLETGQEALCNDLTDVQMRAQLLEILNAVDERYHPGEPKLTKEEAVKIINELGGARKNDALLALGILVLSAIPVVSWAAYNKRQLVKLRQAIDSLSPVKLSRLKQLSLAPKALRDNPAILKKVALSYSFLLAMGVLEAQWIVPSIHSLLAGGMGFGEIGTALAENSANGVIEPQAVAAMRASLEHTRVEKTPLF